MRKKQAGMKCIRAVSVLSALMIFATTVFNGCGNSTSGQGDSVGTTEGSEEILKIGIVNKGYGDEFAYKLAETFEKKTGIVTEVVKSSSASWTENVIKSGAKNNDIDVFFDIGEGLMKNLAVKNYLQGYDRAYVDLSDIYDEKLEGYNVDRTLEEMVFPYSLAACTWGGAEEGYGDGKQYFVNWATGMEGLIYNVGLFEKYNLSIPKTTNEMFELLEQMKTLNNGSYAENNDGRKIYPFAYSGKVNYLTYPATVWMAQYDGINTFNNTLKGKDADGNYSPESAKTAGKLSALQIVGELLDQEHKYSDSNSTSQSFTNVQVLFLDEQAFMMSTGDWLEREMSSNFESGSNVAFMPIPVNSDVVNNCTTVKTDEQLAEVISYIDGELAERPAYVSDEELAYLESVRSMYCCEGNQHVAYIPAYSNNIEAGKQFLQFMLSKEGQEIMLEYAYGNMAMLNVDISEFDYYDSLSQLQQSKYSIFYNATLVGNNYVHPMNYAGGVKIWYGDTMENVFGTVKTSASYKTPLKVFQDTYSDVRKQWSEWVTKAGVSN